MSPWKSKEERELAKRKKALAKREDSILDFPSKAWNDWSSWEHSQGLRSLREFLPEDADIKGLEEVLGENCLAVDMYNVQSPGGWYQFSIMRVALLKPTGVQPVFYGAAKKSMGVEPKFTPEGDVDWEQDFHESDETWQQPGGRWEGLYNRVSREMGKPLDYGFAEERRKLGIKHENKSGYRFDVEVRNDKLID